MTTKILKSLIVLALFFYCVSVDNTLAQTTLTNPEWEFFDDFEGNRDYSFWVGDGIWLNYGVDRPDASSKVLEMTYIPNSEGGGDSWSEYDFNLGIDAVQVEVTFNMFTPVDYYPIENNHKFFYLYSGGYGHSNANIVVNSEGWGSAAGAMPSINVGVDKQNFGHAMNTNNMPVWKPSEGKWSTIQIFLELATVDGDYGFYEVYKDGVLLTATYSSTLVKGWSGAPEGNQLIKYSQNGNFIDKGTLLGWANGAPDGGFLVETKFLIDDFRVRANSVHGASTNEEYALIANTTTGGSLSVPANSLYTSGTIVSITVSPDTGYQFDGWSGDLTGTANPVNIVMDANKTVTATFSQTSTTLYTLTTNTSGSGSASPADGTQYIIGSEVRLTATPDVGWQFVGWSGDLTASTSPAVITIDADKTMTATFAQGVVPANLTINTATTSKSYAGFEAELSFDNDFSTIWSSDIGEWIKYELDAIYTVSYVDIAFFPGNGRTYNLEIELSEDGTNWTTVFSGKSSETTTDPERFDFEDTDARYVRITELASTGGVYTSFAELDIYGIDNSQSQYILTATSSGNGSVTPASGTYDAGTVVSVTATPDAGWQFDGWSGDLTGIANPASITMDANKTVTATFSQQSGGGTAVNLPVSSITASTAGSTTANTIDDDLSTWWSAEGEQWISYDLGDVYTVAYMDMAFYAGNARAAILDIELSVDGTNWTQVFDGQSSGTISGLESFDFPDASARYVRINGHGNTIHAWNTYLEVDIYGFSQYALTVSTLGNGSVSPPSGSIYDAGTVVSVTATPDAGWQFDGWSGGLTGITNPASIIMDANKTVTATFSQQSGGGTAVNLPVSSIAASTASSTTANTIDDDLSTWWSAEGEQWISYDLGDVYTVAYMDMAFYAGNTRAAILDIELSVDGTNWTQVFDGQSSGTISGLESFDFPDASARYVRINGHGNTIHAWNTYLEVDIYGFGGSGNRISSQTPEMKEILSQNVFMLEQNYPNPVYNSTTINYGLVKESHVNMQVLDIYGRSVAELVNENISAGQHSVTLNVNNINKKRLTPGVYFVTINAGESTLIIRMIVK